MAVGPPTVYSGDPGGGIYFGRSIGETLRHESAHGISDAIENMINAEQQDEITRIQRASINTTGNRNPKVSITAGEIYSTARKNVMQRMRAKISSLGGRSSELLAESIERNAATKYGISHFNIGNLTGDVTTDMRMFGPLSTMSESEKTLVHTLMQNNKATALGGKSFGPEKFSGFLHSIVEEAFADDVAMITAPKEDLSASIVSGFFQDTAEGVKFVERPPAFQEAGSMADSISRSITGDFVQGYGRPGGAAWDNYMKSYLGSTMDQSQLIQTAMAGTLDIADESGLALAEKNALRKFATEVYVGSRTGGLVSIAPLEGGLRNTVFHIPGIKDMLGAQGYNENEVGSILGALQKRVTMQQEMFARGETNSLTELVEQVAPARLDLNTPVAKIASEVKRPMIQISDTVAQSVAQRKVGSSSAGRKFFASTVESATGSKVVSAAGKAIRSIFT